MGDGALRLDPDRGKSPEQSIDKGPIKEIGELMEPFLHHIEIAQKTPIPAACSSFFLRNLPEIIFERRLLDPDSRVAHSFLHQRMEEEGGFRFRPNGAKLPGCRSGGASYGGSRSLRFASSRRQSSAVADATRRFSPDCAANRWR